MYMLRISSQLLNNSRATSSELSKLEQTGHREREPPTCAHGGAQERNNGSATNTAVAA